MERILHVTSASEFNFLPFVWFLFLNSEALLCLTGTSCLKLGQYNTAETKTIVTGIKS